jgi:hypothetical protein
LDCSGTPLFLLFVLLSKINLLPTRRKTAEQLNLDPAQIRLISFGKELVPDSDTLVAHRIQDGYTVHAIVRPKDSVSIQPKVQPVRKHIFLFAFTKSNQHHNQQSDKRQLPSRILADQSYFEQLFQLLKLGGSTAQMVRFFFSFLCLFCL